MTRMTLTRNLFLAAYLTTGGLFFSTLASGDVLLIEPVRESANMDLPVNGMSMAEVESRYGTPGSKVSPVGNPPITRWVYDRWSVFFEYDAVLYTVLHKGEVLGDETTAEADAQEETQ